MNPYLTLRVAAAKRIQATDSQRLIDALITANTEKTRVIEFQARELLALRDALVSAEIDKALMVEAVARRCQNYVEPHVRMH